MAQSLPSCRGGGCRGMVDALRCHRKSRLAANWSYCITDRMGFSAVSTPPFYSLDPHTSHCVSLPAPLAAETVTLDLYKAKGSWLGKSGETSWWRWHWGRASESAKPSLWGAREAGGIREDRSVREGTQASSSMVSACVESGTAGDRAGRKTLARH